MPISNGFGPERIVETAQLSGGTSINFTHQLTDNATYRVRGMDIRTLAMATSSSSSMKRDR